MTTITVVIIPRIIPHHPAYFVAKNMAHTLASQWTAAVSQWTAARFTQSLTLSLTLVLTLILTPRVGMLAAGATADDRVAVFDIVLPITPGTANAIKRNIESALVDRADAADQKATFIFRMTVPPDQENYGRGSQFAGCYELASLISGPKSANVATVAFFPNSVQGHAILVALACDEIYMAADSQIGEAAIDETQLTPTIRQAYRDISDRRAKVSQSVIDKMLDKSVELMQAETENGTRLFEANNLAEIRAAETLLGDPVLVKPAGHPGFYTADEARRIGLVAGLADHLTAVAGLMQIAPETMRIMQITDTDGYAIRVDLVNQLTPAMADEIQRTILKAVEGDQRTGERGANFICLWIDSPGGDLAACLKLASFLAFDMDSSKTRIVAYVPHQARSGVALVALACDETAIGPDAVFGGDGSKEYTADEVAAAVAMLASTFSHQTLRRWSLPAAILDRHLEVAEYSLAGNPRVKAFFCDKELAAQPDAALWVKGKTVTHQGQSFSARGQVAVDRLLADRLARDFNDFKTLYHLENEPKLVKPGWVDQLVRALASPWLASMLLFIGFVAVWKEMQTPGLGIGAIVALLCFALFFWSRFLGGTAGWLEAILIISGLVFLAIEIFVLPGFGAFGVFGSLCLVAGFVLASQTFIIPRNSYQFSQMINSGLVLVVSGGGTIAVLMATAHLLHEANRPKDTELVRETEKLADYSRLLGRSGVTTTPLVPSGLAMIGNELIDVSSEGDMLDVDTPIRVVDVRGYRVIVRKG